MTTQPPNNPPTPPADPPDDSKQKEAIKGLFKEALSEWATEQEKTRTETAKPKSLLEGLLNF